MTETTTRARGATEMPVYMRRNEFDPVPELTALRDGPRVAKVRTAFGMDVWAVTRHEDVREVLSDAGTFSNTLGMARMAMMDDLSDAERARMRAGNLLAFDPPDHTRLRRMLTAEFTIRRMRRLEPRIHEIVAEHLDAMEAKRPTSRCPCRRW